VKRLIAAIVGVLVLLGVATVAAHASVKPTGGVIGGWNKPMCGSNDYERIKAAATEFAAVDSAGTCVNSWRWAPDFYVSKVTKQIGWQYPNLSSGYVPTGEATCASSADTCFHYPVRQSDDGTPEASFKSWIASGYRGNESFDIWFSPAKDRHSVTDRGGDTELMIWTAWPGVNDSGRLGDYTTIDGKRFGIMTWEAGHDGTEWRYVAYLWLNAPNGSKGRQVNVSGLWLNPFFRNAESHGWLKSSEYLWAIDLGFEMNAGGARNNIHSYNLTGVN